MVVERDRRRSLSHRSSRAASCRNVFSPRDLVSSDITGGNDWRSPKFAQGVNWTKLTASKQICEKITVLSGPSAMAKCR